MSEKDTFEFLLNQLEIIVRKLEEGDLSLEESKKLFLQGVEIAKKCKERLSETKLEIEDISKELDFDNSI
jgi:exodeoxyribonuclease VII small subunit|tara:strand:- start:516 stop:725 length:210 start_codon:yes stop_codon:yes gene_type:complete